MHLNIIQVTDGATNNKNAFIMAYWDNAQISDNTKPHLY